jgi:hypothetical protein
MTRTLNSKEEGLRFVREALDKAQVTEEVRGKVIAVFAVSTTPWWYAPPDYISYLVSQLITLFSYKFEDERMSIPANMVYLMAADKGLPSILLHWRVYLSLYAPYVNGWRLETIKDSEGKPIGMVVIITKKDGQEWRWERYYDNLQLTSRWKNKELMFAKTILKEALAILFPHLNLLPPLSTVETYDPDDIDSTNNTAPVSVGHIMSVSVHPDPVSQETEDKNDYIQSSVSSQVGNNYNGSHPRPEIKRSAEIVRKMANTPPTIQAKKEKLGEAEISRAVQDKYKELSELVGDEEARKIISGIVKELGAERFRELDIAKQRIAIDKIEYAISAERKFRGDYGG